MTPSAIPQSAADQALTLVASNRQLLDSLRAIRADPTSTFADKYRAGQLARSIMSEHPEFTRGKRF